MRLPPRVAAAGLAGLCLAAWLPGLDWGLPSTARADLVLAPEERTAGLFGRMAAARQAIYDRSGGNPNVELGRKKAGGEPLYEPMFRVPEERLLLAYSSFLVRSQDPDEQRSLSALAQLKPHRFQLNPHYFVYGGLYLYGLGGWLAAAHVVGAIRLVSRVDYYYGDPEAMRRIFLAGRLLSVLLGAAAVLALWRFAAVLGGEGEALAAAALAALLPAVIAQAHLMKPHLPGLLPAALCLLASHGLLDGRASARRYCLAGAAAGAAMSFNPIYAAFCGLSFGTAHLFGAFPDGGLRRRTGRRLLEAALDRRFWLAVACFAGVYLATNPYVLLAWDEFRAEIGSYHLGVYKRGLSGVPLFAAWPLRAGLGLGLWALALPAVLAAAAWGGRADRWLAATVAAAFVYTGHQLGPLADLPEHARYFLPGIAALAVLMVRGVSAAAARFRLPALRAAGLAALFVVNAPFAAANARAFAEDDPASAPGAKAAAWIHGNVPPGARVGVLQATPHLYSEPPFRFGEYTLYSLDPLLRDPGFRPPEPLPEWVAWSVYHPGFPRGDAAELEAFLASKGYTLAASFGPATRHLLSAASLPARVYRRSP